MAEPFSGLRATESSEVALQVMSVISGSEIEILNAPADRNWSHTRPRREEREDSAVALHYVARRVLLSVEI